MSTFKPEEYKFDHFEFSENSKHMYKAVLKKRTDGDYDSSPEAFIWFGEKTKDYVKDKTGLNHHPSNFKGKNSDKKKFHNDNKDLPDYKTKYTPLWFERKVLY